MSAERDEHTKLAILDGLAEFFGAELSVAAKDLYLEAVAGLTPRQMTEGAAEVVRSAEYPRMPLPGELIKAVAGSREQQGQRAWAAVERLASVCGSVQCVVFDDPAIHYAVESLGGWHRWGLWETTETGFKRRDFLRAYDAYRPGDPVSKVLSGWGTCQANRTPVLVESGNAEALAVRGVEPLALPVPQQKALPVPDGPGETWEAASARLAAKMQVSDE